MIYENNTGAISSACKQKRTNPIEIKYHFVQELVECEMIYRQYCPTSTMLADVMTVEAGL